MPMPYRATLLSGRNGVRSMAFQRYNVQKLAFDRWNFRHLQPWLLKAGFSEQLVKEHFVEFGQGVASMSPALRDLCPASAMLTKRLGVRIRPYRRLPRVMGTTKSFSP